MTSLSGRPVNIPQVNASLPKVKFVLKAVGTYLSIKFVIMFEPSSIDMRKTYRQKTKIESSENQHLKTNIKVRNSQPYIN